MKKGSGTRSGLLWEVERILDECVNLPQILLLENVPQVHSEENKPDFIKWLEKLESLGYSNYWKDLSATDYGIPQSRKRTFVISILGDYSYEFPTKQKLKLRLKDMLEDEVDESYYLSESKIKNISEWKSYQNPLDNILNDESISPTLTARGAGEEHSGMILYTENKYIGTYRFAHSDNFMKGRDRFNNNNNISDTILTSPKQGVVIKEKLMKQSLCNELIEKGIVKENDVIRHSYTSSRMNGEMKDIKQNNISPVLDTSCDCLGVVVKNSKPKVVCGIGEKKSNNGTQYYQQDRVYDGENIAMCQPSNLPSGSYYYAFEELSNLRIRKLTPKECFRLMGFSDEDCDKASKVNSNSQLYKQAGNSIVVNVLMAIFKQLF